MKILLDCDPGHDDAIALLLALASPEVDLVGITTVHGNQTLPKTTLNALKLLEFTGRTEIPVAAGAALPIVREQFVAEYNIWVDPEAAERVFQSGLDVTMIGLDVTHQAIFGPEPTAQIKQAGRVGAMVAELLEFYGRFHKRAYGWDGSPIHDAVAMAHA